MHRLLMRMYGFLKEFIGFYKYLDLEANGSDLVVCFEYLDLETNGSDFITLVMNLLGI